MEVASRGLLALPNEVSERCTYALQYMLYDQLTWTAVDSLRHLQSASH